ncbi:MAG TPA: hypothetical protein VKA76_06590, partial [Gammaproteobacteria bacterium]|nr:hypothetical protein [Gammaproteobacteria bacterium]
VADLRATGGIYTAPGYGGVNAVAHSLQLHAHGDIGSTVSPLQVDVGSLTADAAAGGVWIDALSDLIAPAIQSAGPVSLMGDGKLDFGAIKTGGSLALAFGGDVRGHSLQSAGRLSLQGGGNLSFERISAGGTVALNIAGSVTGQSLNVNGLAPSGGAYSGPDATLDVSGDLVLPQIAVPRGLSLHASNIDAGVRQSGGMPPLHLEVTGRGGAEARNVSLQVRAPNGVSFDHLSGAQVDVATNAQRVDVLRGHISNTFDLTTASQSLVMHNQDISPVPAGVQLYQPSHDFWLRQDGTFTDTNGYVLRFGVGTGVRVPNFVAQHIDVNPQVAGSGATRHGERTEKTLGSAMALLLTGAPPMPEGHPMPGPVAAVSGPAVNLVDDHRGGPAADR